MDSYGKPVVRIRLLFDEPGMLSKAQLDQGLTKSWYLVHVDAFSIGQVAARIEHDYLLGDPCPQGIVLEMRGFVLPPAQSARILQDSDLVRVRRKHEGVHSRELVTNSLSVNSLSVDDEEIDHGYRIGRGGLLAMDEFEKEAGGYQGELSEDEDAEFSLSSGERVQDDRKKLRSKESSGKKRKRSHAQKDVLVSPPKLRIELEGLEPAKSKKQKSSGKKKHEKSGDLQILALDELLRMSKKLEPAKSKKQKSSGKKKHEKSGDLQIVALDELPRPEHLDGGVATITEKKKKKNKESAEQTRADIDASPSKEANALEITPSKRRKVKSVKEKGDPEVESGSQKLKPESSHKKEKFKKRQDTNPDNHDQEKSSQVKANNGDSCNDEEAPKQKPSRSALRKKAKKRWLREHGQNGIVPKKDDVKAQQTLIIEQADAAATADSSESESSEDEAEVEAEAGAAAEIEAEEEILPKMCAPGHIRFEPVEDARDEGPSAAPVLLSYTDVRCKKQGQAWGQEKSRGRYSEDGYKRSDRMESRQSEGTLEQPPSLGIVAKKIDFENLPLLSRAPMVGDVLAYQLVELTASWTPELSSYRVGKVSMYDEASTMITLAPVPEYPIHTQQPEDVEDESLDENEFLPPYTPDGTLEVNLATLMEVRVVEEGPVQAKTLDVDATTVDIPMLSPLPAALLCTVPQEPTASADHPQNDHAGGSNGGEVGRSFTAQLEPVLDQPTDAGWQDMLSEEINNKKRELALKARKELEGQNGEGTKKTSNQGDNGKRSTRVNGAPIIRHRYMRTGALGPTMALLRASQTL